MTEPATPPGDAIREKRPWWTYLIPYPGKVPKLSEKQWSVLGLLSLAELFDHYDIGLLGMALSQIQAGLAIPEEEIGGVLAVIRVGSLLAFALSVLADRFGRRRLLLITILGFTLCTFATAFAQNAWQFMVMQLLARVFISAETLLAVVVLTEELSAQDRGWGIGLLGALGSLGHGLAAIAFVFVDDLPFGWRSLYVLGVVPLLFLAYFRRALPETRRFEDQRARQSADAEPAALDIVRPIVHLMRMYPGRVAALAAALFPFDFVTTTAFAFMFKTLQELHGFSPGQQSTLMLAGGALGILGNIFAGAMSDRFGRKPVIALAMTLNAGALYGFYNGSGPMVVFFWISMVFTIMAVEVLFKALGAELFPTSHRSTASGMRMVVGTLGGIAGLALEGTLYQLTGSHTAAITLMMPALVLPPIAIWLFLPETAQQDLESISPER